MSDTTPILCRLCDHGQGVYTIDTDLNTRGIECVAIPATDYAALARQRDELRDAVAIALDEINLAAKTDPTMNGERLLKGIDHVRWNTRVIPALDRLAAAIGGG